MDSVRHEDKIEDESITEKCGRIRPWVRYWARFIDIYLWFMLVNFIIEISHLSINIPNIIVAIAVGLSVVLVIFMLWALIEAILLSKWGYTPGKWLLKATVTDKNGGRLTFEKAF